MKSSRWHVTKCACNGEAYTKESWNNHVQQQQPLSNNNQRQTTTTTNDNDQRPMSDINNQRPTTTHVQQQRPTSTTATQRPMSTITINVNDNDVQRQRQQQQQHVRPDSLYDQRQYISIISSCFLFIACLIIWSFIHPLFPFQLKFLDARSLGVYV